MKVRSALLQRVADALATGSSCAPHQTADTPLKQYSDLLEASIDSRLPEEWSFIKSCAHWHKKTLGAAQQGRIEEAQRLADEIWATARSRPLSEEGGLLMQVLLLPADAYLHYRLEEYDKARELIFHLSALDGRLVGQFGYILLSAHRLQLAHNLLRVHARIGERKEAVDLAATLLDHLELRVEAPSGRLLSPRHTLDAVPQLVLEHYFDKIAAEVGVMLGGSTAGDGTLFKPLAHHAHPEGCPGGPFGSHAHAWLRLKHLLLSGDVETFLVNAMDLLKRGRMSEPLLWFATILDVIAACRSMGAEGSTFAERIEAEASQFADAPYVLKKTVVNA